MLRIHWLLQLSQRWFHQHGRTRRRSSRRVSLMRRRILPSLEVLEDRLAPAVFNVTTTADTNAVNLTTGTDANGQVSLRSALEAANNLGGSNTINLSAADYQLNLGSLNIDNNLTIEGAAPQETVDGPVPTTTIDAQKLSQIFTVSASQVVFLTNLSLDNGQTSAQGGSIYNAGDLTLTGDNIGGEVLGTPGSNAEGGAIFNAASGSLKVINSAISGTAQGGDGSAGANGKGGSNGTNGGNGGQALGGSIYNDGGNVYISDGGVPSFSGSGGVNGFAIGGDGGRGGSGAAQGSPANGNGGNGGAGGEAAGGGIYNTSGGVVIISSGSIISYAYGGAGGAGGVGGYAAGENGGAGGDGGAGGAAMGGGIFNNDGTVLLDGSGSSPITISSICNGGSGGNGGEGATGGSVQGGIGGNGGKGGQGDVGGDGLGGGIYNNTGSIALVDTILGGYYVGPNSISYGCTARGGYGGDGSRGGYGGNFAAARNEGAAGSAGNGAAGGLSAGGGIYNASGTVAITDSQMPGCLAEALGSGGSGGEGVGGSPPSNGGNAANGSNAFGGAIYSDGGNVAITQSLLEFNNAQGADGGQGRGGYYGYGTAGVVAGPGGAGGEGAGGGIAILGGTVTINDSTFAANQAAGGAGGQGGSSEGGKDDVSGAGGAGGNGLGGDISLNGGTLSVSNCTFANGSSLTYLPPPSEAIGGIGGHGGSLSGQGGNGGEGGNGLGGAIYVSSGTLDLSDSTVSGLQAQQGVGGNGGVSSGSSGTSGSAGAYGSGIGGGIDVANGATVNVFNSLIASNTANNVASTDVSGTFTSLGHNLIGNASGATGFGALGDLLGTSANPINPQLGPLTANGGGTAAVPLYTLALQAGSPAIDAPNLPNTPAVSAYDERGVPRDSQSDIGAYEYSSTNNTNGVADVPSLSSPGFQTASANVSNSFNLGSFSDNAPPLSAWKISVDWGDQSSLTTFSVTTTGSLPTQSHTYASAGDYLVAETIVNEQGAVDTAYFVVEVGSPTSAVPANIVATAGNAQTVAPGSTLGTNLQATVTDSSGNPISGVSVIFTAPSSGASGSFAGGVTSVTETTNAEGVATAPAFTANSTTGGYTVTASVSGVATPANFNLVNDVPVTLSALSVPASTQGVAYNQTLTASGGTGSLTVTYKVTSGTVPTGLTFTINGNQLAIAGTPTVSGTVTFDVTATDSIGGSTTLNYTLTINPPVSLSTTSVAPATVGVGYTQTISASGGTGNLTVTYTVATGAIPTGLTFTTNTNQLVIAGTPTAAGSVSFLVTATDSLGASVTHELTLTVSVPTPPPPPPPPSPPPPSPPSAPQTLSTPPLLGLFDQLLGATETVNADGSVTETAHLFGFPLLVSTFDSSGHLESVILFGINVTALFELL